MATLEEILKKRTSAQPVPQMTAPAPQAGPQMTPEWAAQRAEARGPIEQVPGFFGQLAQVPSQMNTNAGQFFGDIMRASTPEAQRQFNVPAPSSIGGVLSEATNTLLGPSGQRIAGGLGFSQDPAMTQPAQVAQPQMTPPAVMPTGADSEVRLPQEQTMQAPVGTGYQVAPEGLVKAIGPDGKMVFADPAAAAQMNQSYAAEMAANTQAQKDFLSSPAARDMSNQRLRAVQDSTYSQAAAEREQRAATQAAGFGQAVSDRERRGTGEMSMADATDIYGSREAGRAAILQQRLGTNEPKDTRTPEQIESAKLDVELKRQEVAEAKQKLQDPNLSDYEKFQAELSLSDLTPEQRKAATLKKFGLDPLDYSNEGATPEATPEAASGDVLMLGTDGKTRKVPAKDKEAALKAGYTLK